MSYRPGVLTAVAILVFITNSQGSAGAISTDDLDNITFQGTVKDSAGAAVSDATVLARHLATGIVRSATSDAEGRYRLVVGAPGAYSLRATAPGFAAQELTKLEVTTGRTIAIDFDLAPAGLNEQVNVVVSSTPLVDTTRRSTATPPRERSGCSADRQSRSPAVGPPLGVRRRLLPSVTWQKRVRAGFSEELPKRPESFHLQARRQPRTTSQSTASTITMTAGPVSA